MGVIPMNAVYIPVNMCISVAPNRGMIQGMARPQPHPRCPACGDDVSTAPTVNGKTLLLERGAWPDGNVIMQGGIAHVLGRNDPRRFDGRILLMPHAAVCRARAKQPA